MKTILTLLFTFALASVGQAATQAELLADLSKAYAGRVGPVVPTGNNTVIGTDRIDEFQVKAFRVSDGGAVVTEEIIRFYVQQNTGNAFFAGGLPHNMRVAPVDVVGEMRTFIQSLIPGTIKFGYIREIIGQRAAVRVLMPGSPDVWAEFLLTRTAPNTFTHEQVPLPQ